MNESGVVQPKLHYVSLPPGTYQQGQFVVADGQLAFLSLDGSSQGQVISIGSQSVNQEVPMVLTAASSKQASRLSRDLGSSTSSTSVASSFESSMIGSGGSLNTFSFPDEQNGRAAHIVYSGNRQVLAQNPDGGVASFPQVVSTTNNLDGSTTTNNNSNNHSYFDARRPTQSPARSESGGSRAAYRGQRSASFDHSRSAGQHMASAGIRESTSVPSFNHIHEEQGGPQYESQRGHQMMRGPPPTQARGRQKRRSNGAVDDGLSMMTSALLTMMDTPEEVAGEQYQDFDDFESSTPVIANHYSAHGALQHEQIQDYDGNYNANAPLYVPQAGKAYYHQEQDNSVGMPGYPMEGGDESYGIPRGRSMEHMQQWSPSMQGDQQLTHQSGQAIQIGQTQHAQTAAFEPRNNGSYFP